jgi:hypothetical protein
MVKTTNILEKLAVAFFFRVNAIGKKASKD